MTHGEYNVLGTFDRARCDTGSAGHRQMRVGQLLKPGPTGQRHRRDQPGIRQEIRIIERCPPHRPSMR